MTQPSLPGRAAHTDLIPARPEVAGIDPYGLPGWEEGDHIVPIEFDE